MRGYEAKRSYTFWWLFQRFSGLLLLLTLLGHIFMVHFSISDLKAVQLTPEQVAARFNDPLMKLFYAVFLIMAVLHGMNGVLNAVDDYLRNDLQRLAATFACWALGFVILIWGLFTLV